MLARLGDLLRVTLERGGEQEIPLEKELEYLARYLEIERVRFHDRLRIENHVAADAAHALVPTFILQPLVENAVRHGIARSTEGGVIRVIAERAADDRLVLTIADSGVGFHESFAPHIFEPFRQADPSARREHGGLGLGLSIARHLVELHGGSITAHSAGIGHGARITVTLPATTVAPGVPTPFESRGQQIV
jgi:signal transduction histidine kinase